MTLGSFPVAYRSNSSTVGMYCGYSNRASAVPPNAESSMSRLACSLRHGGERYADGMIPPSYETKGLHVSVDGDWDVKMDTPMGAQQVKLTLTTDGNKLSGKLVGAQGTM